MRIDAHQHFWCYDPVEYGWIDDSMAVLRRDFLPAELQQEIEAVGIDGVVSVQARQTLVETHWLLEQAAAHPFVKGVVGWVPLADPNVKGQLAALADCRVLKAVRHVVQDEPDDRFLLSDDFNRGIDSLGDFGLAYDLLIFERHLPQAIEFVDRHPSQTIILDHLAKPRARDNQLEPWASNIRRLAERDNVFCKFSGLVTEADWKNWSERELRVYLDVILQAFGPRRIMFGSDWPVCLLAASYRSWYELCGRFTSSLSDDERDRVFGGTAVEAYQLTSDE
jgi:L-fucono-1,5-lactonase